jgi:hypothetical protein
MKLLTKAAALRIKLVVLIKTRFKTLIRENESANLCAGNTI